MEDIIRTRLDKHNNSRIAVQEKLKCAFAELENGIDKAEERVKEELNNVFEAEDTKLQLLVRNVEKSLGPDSPMSSFLCTSCPEQSYAIIEHECENEISKIFELCVSRTMSGKGEVNIEELKDLIEKHYRTKVVASEDITLKCCKLKNRIMALADTLNDSMSALFFTEDARLQALLSEPNIRKARASLVVEQSYSVVVDPSRPVSERCALLTKNTVWKLHDRIPSIVCVERATPQKLFLKYSLFDSYELDVLKAFGMEKSIKAVVSLCPKGLTCYSELVLDDDSCFSSNGLWAGATYVLMVKVEHNGQASKWSDSFEFSVPEPSSDCGWKTYPEGIDSRRWYVVGEESHKVITKTGRSDLSNCTCVWESSLVLGKVASWNIKILKSRYNDGDGICIGVAPFDINQNDGFNFIKCGWYLRCYDSTLCSGPPHNYAENEYGPRKGFGGYVHTGDSVGVVMDTTKCELSFVVDGVNWGVAFDGIPLDKPLVPCVILRCEGDSVELDTSEMKESVNSSIFIPSNITTKNITWDSITLSWNAVERASFYQIEVDESKFWGASSTNTFTKRGFFPETEHSFRVRAVCGNEVSEWSDVVKGRTQKESFETSGWKECPDNVDDNRKYSVDEMNPRTATKINDDGYCTIIGNTPLPHNKVTSWNIKILKPRDNDGYGIFVGVAPSDINQNEDCNYDKCGWYFNCYDSALCSGPPHNYWNKKYGPKKEKGQYIHTGDSVGVVMDTTKTKGKLSFVVNGANLGVTYKGIPLDKPLVPCVLLYCDSDSVELIV